VNSKEYSKIKKGELALRGIFIIWYSWVMQNKTTLIDKFILTIIKQLKDLHNEILPIGATYWVKMAEKIIPPIN